LWNTRKTLKGDEKSVSNAYRYYRLVIFQFKSVHFNRYLLHCELNSSGAKYKARTKTNITQKQYKYTNTKH